MRDLFAHDDGGWLQDVPLLDRLVTEKLKAEAETIAAEGWKWIAVAVDFPYSHTSGLRELEGEPVDLTEREQATLDALNAEYLKIEEDYQDRRTARRDRSASRRNRGGAVRPGSSIARLRSGRDRPCRRLRQHRCRGFAVDRPWLRAAGG
jgi:ParB family chromosome partitioning protein